MKNTRLRPANKQSEKRESWMLLLLSLWLFFQCLFHGRDDQREKKKHHEPLALSLSVCWRERMTSLCASDVMPRFPKKKKKRKKNSKYPATADPHDPWESVRSEGVKVERSVRRSSMPYSNRRSPDFFGFFYYLFIFYLFFLFLCVEVKKMKKRKEKKEREI